MTGVRDQETGDRRHETEDRKPGPWIVSCLLILVVLALPIFAHGCHSGDHDDEPLFAPPAQQQEPPR
jgi:hypothetical protein